MPDHLPHFYLLNDDHSLREASVEEWGHAFSEMDRRVAFTGNETKFVSTVFIGLDHRYFGDGPPLVFETMVFRDGHGDECERYGSWAAAEAGHKRFVEKYLINPETRAKVSDE